MVKITNFYRYRKERSWKIFFKSNTGESLSASTKVDQTYGQVVRILRECTSGKGLVNNMYLDFHTEEIPFLVKVLYDVYLEAQNEPKKNSTNK